MAHIRNCKCTIYGYVTAYNALVITYTCIYMYMYMCRFWALPAFMLKRQILMNLPSENLEVEVAHSIDFMAERVSKYIIRVSFVSTCIYK